MTPGAVEAGSAPPSPEALLAYEPLVRRIARQVHRSASASVELDELVQTGLLALVQASRGFVPRGEGSFTAYALLRARGAMIDVLRGSATINRAAMRRRRKLKQAEAELTARLGRAPTTPELADELGLSAAELRAAVDGAQPVFLEPLDAIYSDRAGWFACELPNAEERLAAESDRAELAAAIARLPHRHAMVLQLYFIEEWTLEQIGDALGVGAARVCQIKRAALARLRREMASPA
jgi:RNA polymerase sigma factor for flagellar operon FliA